VGLLGELGGMFIDPGCFWGVAAMVSQQWCGSGQPGATAAAAFLVGWLLGYACAWSERLVRAACATHQMYCCQFHRVCGCWHSRKATQQQPYTLPALIELLIAQKWPGHCLHLRICNNTATCCPALYALQPQICLDATPAVHLKQHCHLLPCSLHIPCSSGGAAGH
jgi:hypothetical protein